MSHMPKRFIERYENIVDDKEAFFSTLLKRTKKSFRVNTLKSSVSEVRKRMKSYGIEIKNMEWYPEAFVSENPFVSSTLEHFLGYIYMQELASMLPVLAARKDIRKAELVLDCCAAPGSKTTQMAAIMKDRGTIIANDLSYERIRALKFNLEKSGVLNAVITNQDIRFFKGGDKLRFDVVILDAPCSSEGTVRKNPGILRNWSENYIRTLAGIQKQMISKAFEMLSEGGVMIYSTCTFAPEENEEVAFSLLEKTGAQLEEIKIPKFRTSPGLDEWMGKKFGTEMEKAVRVWPHHNDTDGFFIAKITK